MLFVENCAVWLQYSTYSVEYVLWGGDLTPPYINVCVTCCMSTIFGVVETNWNTFTVHTHEGRGEIDVLIYEWKWVRRYATLEIWYFAANEYNLFAAKPKNISFKALLQWQTS